MNKHTIQLMAATFLLLPLLLSPAWAATKYCTLDVFSAYDKAIKNGWKFGCGGNQTSATFVPLHAERKIACMGKTNYSHQLKYFTGSFFRKGKTSTSFHNGWKLHSYEVSGGQWTKRDISGAKVTFYHETFAVNTQWSRKLSKLVLKKSNGNCSKVYDEAF